MLVAGRFSILLLVVLSWLLASCQTRPKSEQGSSKPAIEVTQADSRLVRVNGVQLILRDKPYYSVGANFELERLEGNSDGGLGWGSELDVLKASGVNSIRLSLASEGGFANEKEPAVKTVYEEPVLRKLDSLLDETAKRDMTLVVVLNLPARWWISDELDAKESRPIINSPSIKSPTTIPFQNSAVFYRSEMAQTLYHNLLRQILDRVNTVNGRDYRTDPTIMAWQIPNTLSLAPGLYDREYFDLYKSWIENTASFIKSLDPHHLVSVVSDGAMSTLQSIDLYRETQSFSGIDYVTVHLWPKTWGWLDGVDAESTKRSAISRSKAYLLQHLLAAKALDKPLLLEEFGFGRDPGEGLSTVDRDLFYSEIFAFIEQQAEIGAPIAGSNFAVWGGVRKPIALSELQEGWAIGELPDDNHQLLNSVFDGDQSTLRTVADHAQIMRNL